MCSDFSSQIYISIKYTCMYIYIYHHTKVEVTRKNAIVEYLHYQIPITRLKGPKGNVDMQAAKPD